MLGFSGRTKVSAALRSGCAQLGVARRALHHQHIGPPTTLSPPEDNKNARLIFSTPRTALAMTAARRYKSNSPEQDSSEETSQHANEKISPNSEMISFPTVEGEGKPVLLNAQEHAVGYLSKILNARVYDVAKETDLQEAKNLSAVRFDFCSPFC